MNFNFCIYKQIKLLQQNVTSVFRAINSAKSISYVQGQSPKPGIREYFYYIDHQGMLFLDDTRMKNFTSCFKDKQFLKFFFSRLRVNNSGQYVKEFPYISLCGRERNFIRCDDLPIVFTHIIQGNNNNGELVDYFCYGHAGDLLKVPFEPNRIIMNAESGRVYHPAPPISGGIGLVKSSLAIELSSLFKFENGEEKSPTKFIWKDKCYELDANWFKNIEKSY